MEKQRLRVTIELIQRGRWFIARIPELDFIAQGKTVEEAKGNLDEVVRIQFAEMRKLGTLKDYLAECGFRTKAGVIKQDIDIIGFEKHVLQVA